jgi:hypothetical protein
VATPARAAQKTKNPTPANRVARRDRTWVDRFAAKGMILVILQFRFSNPDFRDSSLSASFFSSIRLFDRLLRLTAAPRFHSKNHESTVSPLPSAHLFANPGNRPQLPRAGLRDYPSKRVLPTF